MKHVVRHILCPILTAMIWGFAFPFQSIAGQYVSPLAIYAFRGIVPFVVMTLLCVILRRKPGDRKKLFLGGLICGTALFAASVLQQYGINETSAGKAGFITAMYIVLVPILGMFLKKKTGWSVWLAVVIAVAGMYFLCITEGFSVSRGDLLVLLCALIFAVQILAVDHFVNYVDGMALSAAQFLVAGIFGLIGALIEGSFSFSAYGQCIGSLLYLALFSSCVGYTLQIVSQKGGNPTVISLLLSLESVFAVIGGAIILHETMTVREWIGCGLMACAIVIAQIPSKKAADISNA